MTPFSCLLNFPSLSGLMMNYQCPVLGSSHSTQKKGDQHRTELPCDWDQGSGQGESEVQTVLRWKIGAHAGECSELGRRVDQKPLSECGLQCRAHSLILAQSAPLTTSSDLRSQSSYFSIIPFAIDASPSFTWSLVGILLGLLKATGRMWCGFDNQDLV